MKPDQFGARQLQSLFTISCIDHIVWKRLPSRILVTRRHLPSDQSRPVMQLPPLATAFAFVYHH